jgi:hypothetical protein
MPRADISVHPNQLARPTMIDGINVRGDVLFTNADGEEKSSFEKRGTKIVQKLSPALQKVVRPGETLLYVLRGRVALSGLEQFFSPAWIRYLGACVIVATNSRVLFFPVKSSGAWRESVRAVNWGDLEQVQKSGIVLANSIFFKSRDGSKTGFREIRGADAKKLAAIANVMIPAAAGEQTSAQGVVQLCPDCLGTLTTGRYLCPACGLVFKNEKTMIWRSIFLPGGGYFYTGHPVVGTFISIVEVLFIIDVLRALFVPFSQHALTPDLSGGLAGLAFIWVAETAITILHCRRFVREFIPERRRAAREAVARAI